MKTVEMLAKYLHQWPDGYSRLVHIEGIFFGTPTDHGSTLLAMSNDELAGFIQAEDSGTSVTEEEWSQHKFKGRYIAPGSTAIVGETISAGSLNPHSSDSQQSELLYAAKLQCMSAAMLQGCEFTKERAVIIAEAINAGFDKIGLPNQQTGRGEMVEYIKQAIGEGYQPKFLPEQAIIDLSIIDNADLDTLINEHGNAWQWYDLGGGIHETVDKPMLVAFKEVAEPLMKYLAENHHPHTSVIVTGTVAELVVGSMSHVTDQFLKD